MMYEPIGPTPVEINQNTNQSNAILLLLLNSFEMAMKLTRISPSAEPVTKCSSCGSMAKHLIALSCAWKRCRSERCRTSNMQTSPFLPAEINS